MDIIIFFTVTISTFFVHYLLFTKKTKLFLQDKLGKWFIHYIYRLLYALFSLIIIYVFIKNLLAVPNILIVNMQDHLSNIVFLIIDTFRLIFLFLMVESLWTIGLTNLLGIKHLLSIFTKNKPSFQLDFIVDNFTVKGLYLRHRHPFLFYLVLFILLDRTLTLRSILAITLLSSYYILFAKMLESQLEEIFSTEFRKYKAKTNFFLLMISKYKNESVKK